jgi:hypothetical protein
MDVIERFLVQGDVDPSQLTLPPPEVSIEANGGTRGGRLGWTLTLTRYCDARSNT